MEIRIGFQNSAREIVVENDQDTSAVQKLVNTALEKNEKLTLVDAKGRVVIVAASAIAYVDIAAPESRKVGFGGQ
ncbi:MAG: hypothetical protein RIS09_976 [Actinomycetota bacterium]|jgi:hypothetical protein